MPVFTHQQQRIAKLWSVVISPSAEGTDRRLSWPVWLVTEVVCPSEDGHPSEYLSGLTYSNFADTPNYHIGFEKHRLCFSNSYFAGVQKYRVSK